MSTLRMVPVVCLSGVLLRARCRSTRAHHFVLTLVALGATWLSAPRASAETLTWTQSAGGPREELAGAPNSRATGGRVAVDPAGNVYVTGSFEDAAVFAPDRREATLRSEGRSDVFVAKYDRAGTLLWARRAGGKWLDSGTSIAVDARGQSYVTGTFTRDVVFGAGEPRETRLRSPQSQVFVAKFATDGALIWAKQAQGSNARSGGNAGVGIGVDDQGSVYVAGRFNGWIDLAGTRRPSDFRLSSAREEVFLAKYDATGTLVWAQQGRESIDDHPTSLAVDGSGNSYLTGGFRGRVTFGEGARKVTLSNFGYDEGFVAKFASDGALVWAKQGDEGEYYIQAADVAADVDGASLLVGTLGYRPSQSPDLPQPPAPRGFVRKLDKDGGVVWSAYFGGRPTAVAVASTRGVIIAGGFDETAVFGHGEQAVTLRSAGADDVFLAGYRGDGSFAWAYDLVSGPGDEAAGGIAIDAADHRHVVGSFENQVTFMRGEPRSAQRTSAGESDVFVTKVTRFAD